ncbi:MAG: Ig-like domain-containing protein [Patescibacteria group bacterium]
MKYKIILGIIIVLTAAYIFLSQEDKPIPEGSQQSTAPMAISENEPPKIVSTKPDPLEGSIVSAKETVEIRFNKPLENAPEFKHRIDPEIEYNLELSFNRKTVKITPKKEFELGTTYTLFIHQDAKFEGGERLDGEKVFHFRTIQYSGV